MRKGLQIFIEEKQGKTYLRHILLTAMDGCYTDYTGVEQRWQVDALVCSNCFRYVGSIELQLAHRLLYENGDSLAGERISSYFK